MVQYTYSSVAEVITSGTLVGSEVREPCLVTGVVTKGADEDDNGSGRGSSFNCAAEATASEETTSARRLSVHMVRCRTIQSLTLIGSPGVEYRTAAPLTIGIQQVSCCIGCSRYVSVCTNEFAVINIQVSPLEGLFSIACVLAMIV